MCWDCWPDKNTEEIDGKTASAWLGYDFNWCIGGNHTPSSTMLAAIYLLLASSGEQPPAVTGSVILFRVPSVLLTRAMYMHATVNIEANVARPAQLLVLSALKTGVECLPPEPPPLDSRADKYCFDINAMLECIPHKKWDAFAQQYIADEVTATDCPHPSLSGVQPLHEVLSWRYRRIHVPPRPHHVIRNWWNIIYHRRKPVCRTSLLSTGLDYGSKFFNTTSISDHPVWVPSRYAYNNRNHEYWGGILSWHFHGKCHTSGWLPASVCGLKGDEGSFVPIMRAAVGWDVFNNPSLMDGGANICITSILGLLVDVVSIPPLPILVASTSGTFLLDDCCTKRGLILLTISGGLVYYQPCYYCKNDTITIMGRLPKRITFAVVTFVV